MSTDQNNKGTKTETKWRVSWLVPSFRDPNKMTTYHTPSMPEADAIEKLLGILNEHPSMSVWLEEE